MATLGDLKTRVADELLKRNLNAQIASHIAKAIEFYSGRRFWFNTGRMVGTAVAPDADGYVALPTGTRLIDQIRIGNIVLEKREATVIDELLALSPSTGEVSDYAVAGDRIRLYPTPVSTVALAVVGTFDLAALSTDAASNAWTNEAADLIAARTRMTMCRDVLRDPDGVSLAKDAVREAETDLDMKTMRRLGRGRVSPSL
jgi:hypothetical protein